MTTVWDHLWNEHGCRCDDPGDAPIDVKRLTAAYRNVMGWETPDSWMEDVAAEYVRLGDIA